MSTNREIASALRTLADRVENHHNRAEVETYTSMARHEASEAEIHVTMYGAGINQIVDEVREL